MSRRLVLTGASGFLGRYLVAAAVEAGWQVEAWYRCQPGPSKHESVHWRRVDVGDDATVDLDCLGEPPAAIVHAAALAHSRPSPEMAERVRQVNIEGTRRVLEVASSWRVSRVVLISSVLAGGAVETPSEGQPEGLYGEAKRQAEALLETWCTEDPRRTGVALRLPLVYGVGVRANFGRLVWLARRGCVLQVGAGEARRSLLAAPNAASAALVATDTAALAAGYHLFTVTDARPYRVREIGETLCHAAHLGAVPLWLPRGPMQVLARLGDAAERRLGRPLPWSSAVLAKLGGDAVYEGAAFQRATGWCPEVSLADLAPAMVRATSGGEDAKG